MEYFILAKVMSKKNIYVLFLIVAFFKFYKCDSAPPVQNVRQSLVEDVYLYRQYDAGGFDKNKIQFSNVYGEKITFYYLRKERYVEIPNREFLDKKFSNYTVERLYSKDEIDLNKSHLVFYFYTNSNLYLTPGWKIFLSLATASIFPMEYNGYIKCAARGRINGNNVDMSIEYDIKSHYSILFLLSFPLRVWFHEDYEDVCFYYLLEKFGNQKLKEVTPR